MAQVAIRLEETWHRSLGRYALTGVWLAAGLVASTTTWPMHPPIDFMSFYQSAASAVTGYNPYAEAPVPNLNPPVSLFLFLPFLVLDPLVAARAWWIGTLVCYAAALAVLRLAWAVASVGVLWTLQYGQLYVLLLLPLAGAWAALGAGRLVLVGALLGLVAAVKPQFLVRLGLLLLAGHGRILLGAAPVFVAAWIAPALAFGPRVIEQWQRVAFGTEAGIYHNASLIGQFRYIGLAPVGLALAALLLAGASWWAWRTRPVTLDAVAVGVLVALLIGPLTWIGYAVLATPVVLGRRWRRPWWPALALLSLPLTALLPIPLGAVLEGMTPRLHLPTVLVFAGFGIALAALAYDLTNPSPFEAAARVAEDAPLTIVQPNQR